MKDFSMLQAVTYTVKVVLSRKWCKIDRLLLQTTNRKCHMAYRKCYFGWLGGRVVSVLDSGAVGLG